MHQSMEDEIEYDNQMSICRRLSDEINNRIAKLMHNDTESGYFDGTAIWQEFQEWYCVEADAILVPYNYDR